MKHKVKKCKSCGELDKDNFLLIQNGRCISCRVKLYEKANFNILTEAPFRLMVTLSTIILFFTGVSVYAFYHKRIVLPYGGSRRGGLLIEFVGSEIAMPVLALSMLSIGLLTIIASNHLPYFEEKSYKRIMQISLWTGLFIYIFSFFLGREHA